MGLGTGLVFATWPRCSLRGNMATTLPRWPCLDDCLNNIEMALVADMEIEPAVLHLYFSARVASFCELFLKIFYCCVRMVLRSLFDRTFRMNRMGLIGVKDLGFSQGFLCRSQASSVYLLYAPALRRVSWQRGDSHSQSAA
jgi:hypothetical protein